MQIERFVVDNQAGTWKRQKNHNEPTFTIIIYYYLSLFIIIYYYLLLFITTTL